MQDNNVFLNGQDIIEIQPVGAQTEDSVRAMGEETKKLIAYLNEKHMRVMILDDLTRLTEADGPARNLLVDLGKTLEYDKFAMFGGNRIIRLGANLLFSAIGKGSRLHYFSTREEAETWLLKK